MPDWTPDWSDVVFDHAAADAAASACRAAARRVDDGRGEMPGHRRAALAEWRGGYAEDFRAEETATGDELERVAGELRTLAAAIEAASRSAVAEQLAREASRERWRRERAAELEADRLARPGGPRIPF